MNRVWKYDVCKSGNLKFENCGDSMYKTVGHVGTWVFGIGKQNFEIWKLAICDLLIC